MNKVLLRFLPVGPVVVVCVCLNWVWTTPAKPAATATDVKTVLRRPCALVLAEDGKWLFTANQRSGSISVIDTKAARTVAEVDVGRKLVDLAAMPDGKHLVAVDESTDELVFLQRKESALETVKRLRVGAAPVSVQVTPDGKRCAVAALWSRRLDIVSLGKEPKVVKTIDLPFAPCKQLLVGDGKKLIVADGFGGRLGVVDMGRGALESVRWLPGHNIRGLALSRDGESLFLVHQVLNPLARTTRHDILWGNLITNDFRALVLANVLDPKADLLRDGALQHLGDVNGGAGDPSAVAVADRQVIIALAGINKIIVGTERNVESTHLAGARRPTAIVPSPDGQRAYVANTFADSVSVVDLKTDKVVATIKLGPQPELKPSDRGELLFHDARLSHDGWMSCQSCHTDGHSNGQLADTLGDGTYGTPKRVLSLLGVKDTAPYAWNGSMKDLPAQISKTIETTMRGKKLTAEQVSDLTAYLKTLSPPPSLAGSRHQVDDDALRRGREVFTKQSCGNCHTPPTYTSAKTYDVGLADEAGHKAFNPPSLRGVSQGGPYFHDGRAATLAEVFTRHRHQLKNELPKKDLDDLLSFLASL
jgi:YVTN family beta-propeller protein